MVVASLPTAETRTVTIYGTDVTLTVQDSGNTSPIPSSGASFTGGTGSTLIVNDSTHSTQTTYGISPTAVTFGSNSLSYSGVSTLTLEGGTSAGDIYNVTGTVANTTTKIYAGNAANSVFNITGTATGRTTSLSSLGTDANVYVGTTNTMQSTSGNLGAIAGSISVAATRENDERLSR